MVTINRLAPARPARSRRGAAIVEFAICFAVFLVIFLGIIQYAIVMFNANALNQVARETARYAAVHGLEVTSDDPASDPVSIRAELQTLCNNGPLKYSNILNTASTATTPLITQPTSSTPSAASTYASRYPGQLITITIQYNMGNSMFLKGFIPGLANWSTMTVQSTTVVDILGVTQ